jgi:hypothetical protein
MTRAVIDSSTWISLARSGLLPLLSKIPVEPVLIDVVEQETIAEGLAGGHGDAQAIRDAAPPLFVTASRGPSSTDEAVLLAAIEIGTLVANDVALGRRARSLGVLWLRSADLIVLAVRKGTVGVVEGRRAIQSLLASGRITSELADAYGRELA